MTSLTISVLDEAVAARLRRSAASHGRSAEDEARAIIEHALHDRPASASPSGADLWADIRRRVETIGGLDLDIPPRGPGREPLETLQDARA
ncbi:FitA-like ribbon-helix-helix domain-containing protein [Roseospira navarrensis]|uniref:Plasmid stabilization protein n=1 Tax=Roseospira navarrensis TaxID=140058 RepID=A0A7X2D241_9PROT|nr:plasmid stabilization protein [Roseospira navarrensis]MQX35286.1 plasmid stabilization protein [Roseospira navarrensis]